MAPITDTNRFKDQNLRISHFEDEVFVECPKCAKRAVVTKNDPSSYFSEKTLKCPNCFYSLSGRHQSFDITLNCNCSHCAAELKVDMKNVNEQKDSIAIKCGNCGKTEKYQPQNISQEWYFKATGKPSEDYFGLPLWLEADFRGHNLLAYNYKHLAYLKQYISADLRERSNRSHWTMVEKLPTWMTSAKNRDKIIKLISDLEKK